MIDNKTLDRLFMELMLGMWGILDWFWIDYRFHIKSYFYSLLIAAVLLGIMRLLSKKLVGKYQTKKFLQIPFIRTICLSVLMLVIGLVKLPNFYPYVLMLHGGMMMAIWFYLQFDYEKYKDRNNPQTLG